MPKKNLIEEALIEARELEQASIENAKELVLESFNPDFVNFFKDVLSEGDHKEPDGDEDGKEPDDHDEMDEGEKPIFKKGVKPDFGKKDDDEEDDDAVDEGNEHDMGKEPDNGRQGTDPAVDDEEESLPQDQKDDPMKEGKYDDVKGDATPEKGQAGLPKKGMPKTKKVGDSGWKDEGTAGYAADDPEKSPGDMPGKKPSTKQTGDSGWEKEHEGGQKHADTANAVPGREGLAGTPKPPVKVAEADKDDEKKDKEDLDVPDELFDEANEPDLKDDFDGDDDDVEIDIDVKDDDDKDKTDEGVDVNIDADDEDDEEIDEGLYIRENGQFKKITPAEYLQTRITALEEEVAQYKTVAETLQGQLQETHVFNAKLAHLNKLYMSGTFTNSEKERIAERLDECDSISDVKSLYKTIISEVQDTNPLDDFSKLIKEQRVSKETKTENIYESRDVSRMKRLMNYELDQG